VAVTAGVRAIAGALGVLFMLAGSLGSRVQADEPPAAGAPAQAEAEARALFERGKKAAAEGRVADARALFERSLALYPTAAGAYNLALLARDAGDYRATVELTEALLDDRYGELTAARRREVSTLHAEALAMLSRVAIRIGGTRSATVRIDGRRRGLVRPKEPLTLRVNPGRHVVRVEGPGLEPRVEPVRVEAGRRAQLTLDPALAGLGASASVEAGASPVGVRAVPQGPEPSEPSDRRWWRRPLPWIVSRILAAGAAGLTVWAVRRDEDGTDFGTVRTALRRRR
jgi:hypothetical protein